MPVRTIAESTHEDRAHRIITGARAWATIAVTATMNRLAGQDGEAARQAVSAGR